MTTLFDIAEAERAANAGIARAERNADAAWIALAVAAIRSVCMSKPEFIVDDVQMRIGDVPKPQDGRAMGVAMRRAVKAGMCERTGRYVASAQRQCHGNPRQCWRSKLFVSR